MTNITSQLPLTLCQLYGNDVVFTSRPSFGKNPWLTTEFHQANMLTARELLIANMPVIVHEATVGEKSRVLMEAAGLDFPTNYRTFSDKDSYHARLREAESNNEKIFFQYTHENEFINESTYYINKKTFIALNNKMRLSDWTKGKFLPKREVILAKELRDKLATWHYPYVIKPGDDHPTAGGYGVMICYNDEDREKSLQRIENANVESDFVVEDYIDTHHNFCVQYAYSDELGLKYIGASIQNTDKYGKYKGNITAENVPQSVIDAGKEIMMNGVNAGYRGIAGFDLLVDSNDDVFAIDLNFRQNGSTSLLLFNDLLDGKYKKFLGYIAQVDNESFFNRIHKEVVSGRLFPLAYYDGDYYEETTPSRFVGIWHGEQHDVEAHDASFLQFNQVK